MRLGLSSKSQLPFLDLTRQTKSLAPALRTAVSKTIASGTFILGPQVAQFEQEFARFCGARFGVGVASGTDALELSLRAANIKRGDLVATVSFTFMATVDAVLHVGAEPLFIDMDPATFNMDPADLERRIQSLSAAHRRRLKTIIPVHLYGQPCDMEAILRIARRHRLRVIEDVAQAAGARWRGKPAGSWGDMGCFSFYPSKNLGAFGDAGAVVTSSAALANRLRRLRAHGRADRDRQLELGRNSRLDELQAAILRVKLKRLSAWVKQRQVLAAYYSRLLGKISEIHCPKTVRGATHAFYAYVIRATKRDALKRYLAQQGIPTMVYYATPVHQQPIHRRKFSSIRLPETEQAAREVLALPIFPELKLSELRQICSTIARFYSKRT